MRITEGRLVALAAARSISAQSRFAESGDKVSTGIAVDRPSDDPVAWASGQRARLRHASSSARGSNIATASEQLASTDGALDSLGQIFSRLKELSIQSSNETLGLAARQNIALEVRGLFSQALASANTRGPTGEYLFGGSRGDSAPFSDTGVYGGDGIASEVETAEGNLQIVSITGESLTAAAGVDILVVMSDFATALEANDVPTLQTMVGQLGTAIEQISGARSSVGAMMSALDNAEHSRTAFELNLAQTIANAVETDPIAAAAELAQTSQALETAHAVTTRVVDLLRPR